MQNMFKNMDGLYTDISEFFTFDKQKYTIEEFFGDIKTFKDAFEVKYIIILVSFLLPPPEKHVSKRYYLFIYCFCFDLSAS